MQITKAAYDFLKPHLDNTGKNGIRLEVKGSGCSGYKIVSSYLEGTPNEDDWLHLLRWNPEDPNDGIRVVVDRTSQVFLEGTTIDLVQEGLNSVLTYDIPKATSECGCGSSFSFSLPESDHS